MTLRELKEAVALLGFESNLQDIDDTALFHFRYSLNRALWNVYALRPTKKRYVLHHFPPVNLLPYENRRHKGGVSLELSASGAKAYSFSVSGSGTCTVHDNGQSKTLTWQNQTEKTYAGLLVGPHSRLVFTGEYDYMVRFPAMWDRCESGRVEDILPGDTERGYHLPSLVDDFWRLDESPFVEHYPHAKVECGVSVWLPMCEAGIYRIRYLAKCQSISENDTDSTLIALDDDLCQLLPLLVASYLCLDDDPNKATYYYRQFSEGCARISAERAPTSPPLFVSHNHW